MLHGSYDMAVLLGGIGTLKSEAVSHPLRDGVGDGDAEDARWGKEAPKVSWFRRAELDCKNGSNASRLTVELRSDVIAEDDKTAD